jgi:hypothetical protein
MVFQFKNRWNSFAINLSLNKYFMKTSIFNKVYLPQILLPGTYL